MAALCRTDKYLKTHTTRGLTSMAPEAAPFGHARNMTGSLSLSGVIRPTPAALSAQIWVGEGSRRGNRKAVSHFMYRPALLTLQAGLLSAGITASINYDLRLLRPALKAISPADLFIWMGALDLDAIGAFALHNLTVRGVLTVYYSTEADAWHSCAQKQKLVVREVWEYSRSNTLCCNGVYRKPWRFVPPGFIPGGQLAQPSAEQQLVFIGSNSRWYDMRQRCLGQIDIGLKLTRASGALPHMTASCESSFCALPDCGNYSCPLRVSNTAHSDLSWKLELQRTSTFLNLHKACNDSAVYTAACETFRFAPLLSAGAAIVSEHCHSADEADYEGLVNFAPVADLAAAATASWRDHARGATSVHERSALFAERFSPAAIFERAGITAMLAAHQAHRREAPANFFKDVGFSGPRYEALLRKLRARVLTPVRGAERGWCRKS